jgi:sialate O-acetylesterase
MRGQLAQLAAVSSALDMTHLFGDNMVLDFREPAVHGRASPGAAISVSFNGIVGKTTAGTDGLWRAVLGGSACADMPRNATLTVVDNAGGSAKAVNVACGQVFVCTGQSSEFCDGQ